MPFQHHAIDTGNGNAVHFSDGEGDIAGPGLRADQFAISQVESPADQIAERALSQSGRRGYNLLYDHCEHFTRWCVGELTGEVATRWPDRCQAKRSS